jgi:hypothetical protein
MNSNDHFSESIFFLEEPLIKKNVGDGSDALAKIRTCKILIRLKLISSL